MPKKRVWCLYRVSGKRQVSAEEDIPLQEQACHQFAKSMPNWEITKELYEKGKSGWKLRADQRDELMTIRQAAIDKEFDVLCVFLFDRIGRKEDESPHVVQFLVEQGIEVWSAKEGQAKIEEHTDLLINYIRFWQASGESKKTSIRSRERKKQLSNENYFQGGAAPYGYKIVETDQPHWKDKERFIKILLPDEYESKVVKLIFYKYTEYHYGYRKIVDYLNENGYRKRDGNLFAVNLVQRVIDNSIYIGLKRYKSYDGQDGDTQPYNEKLRIISDEIFYKAQDIRNKRKGSINSQDKTGIPKSGRLMFSGIAFCNYCGSKLSGNYLYRKNKKPHNPSEYYQTIVYRYRCPLNKGKSGESHDKNIWGAKKFDEKIINDIKDILGSLNIDDFIDKSIDKKRDLLKMKRKTLNELEKEKKQNESQLLKLNSEIANSLMGKSSFTPEQLSGAIDGITKENESLQSKIEKLSIELEMEESNDNEIRDMAEELKNWREKFDNANSDLKKAMLSRVVDKVHLRKDDAVIEFNANIKLIVDMIEGEIEYK